MRKHRKRHPILNKCFFSLSVIGLIFSLGYLGKLLFFNDDSGADLAVAVTSDFDQLTGDSNYLDQSTSQSSSETSESPALPGNNYQNLNKVVLATSEQDYNQQLKARQFIGSALIIKNGQVVLSQGYGYQNAETGVLNTPETHFQIGSVQKGMTAVMIAQLIAQGKLSYDTPLSTFYPSCPGAYEITIDNLLRMQSGLHLKVNPNNLTDDHAIINFDINHLTYTGVGKYQYMPVNYVLLSGIIEIITNQSYYAYFNQTFAPMALKNYGFYQDWYQRANHSVSYQAVATEDTYAKPIKETIPAFARELGTGNLDMTAGDLYWYYHELMSGKILNPEQLGTLWMPKGSQYICGLYDRGNYYRAHGVEQGQRCMVMMTKDLQNVVILLTNRNNGDGYGQLVSNLFAEISGINDKF